MTLLTIHPGLGGGGGGGGGGRWGVGVKRGGGEKGGGGGLNVLVRFRRAHHRNDFCLSRQKRLS